jgi:hypothetical protein
MGATNPAHLYSHIAIPYLQLSRHSSVLEENRFKESELTFFYLPDPASSAETQFWKRVD